MEQGKIIKVAGPLVVADGLGDAKMFDLVKVGTEGLMGEIIEMRGDRASIQVYEETEGIGPGDPVEATGAPLSVELGPGMLGAVYDGVQRPLDELERQAGSFLARGISAPGLGPRQALGVRGDRHGRRRVSRPATSSAPCRRTRSSSTASWCRRAWPARSSRSPAAATR